MHVHQNEFLRSIRINLNFFENYFWLQVGFEPTILEFRSNALTTRPLRLRELKQSNFDLYPLREANIYDLVSTSHNFYVLKTRVRVLVQTRWFKLNFQKIYKFLTSCLLND